MMTRHFSSFEQIDTQLEILAVERQLSLYRIRANLGGAMGSTLRTGLQLAWKPLLRTLLVSLAVKGIKRRLAAMREDS
jgi:hypothetical protein